MVKMKKKKTKRFVVLCLDDEICGLDWMDSAVLLDGCHPIILRYGLID